MPIRFLAALLALAAQHADAAITTQAWGATGDGAPVAKTTLENERGMRLSYIDFGATITAIDVPDRAGRLRNVILSLPSLRDYEATRRRHGAVIGRYAGRIGNARFVLDGVQVALPKNAKGLAIHGDPHGYDKRVWRRTDFADTASIGSVFHLASPAGDQGFPGNVDISVTYRLLRKRNEFRIEYGARSDAPTVVNLTNHGFFNLAGAGTAGLASHTFRIAADRYVLTDQLRVPTGELAGVAGTVFDFRRPASMHARLAGAPWFDHGLVFSKTGNGLELVATVDEAGSGRRMEIRTTEPSLILNSGNGFDGSETGSEGRAYLRHDGFAFETQHLADSPNHPQFPSTELRPGRPLRSMTSYRFSTR